MSDSSITRTGIPQHGQLKHRVGVGLDRTVEIAKLDEDFFK